MTARRSAALLAYRRAAEGGLHVFLGHMGGPWWAHKDDRGWSIPKGEYDVSSEEPQAAARREFTEEIGTDPPWKDVLDLGVCVQPSGKRIRTFAVPADSSLRFHSSSRFSMEWPRGSGIVAQFPEIDRAQWFGITEARRKVVRGQVPILDTLAARAAGSGRPAGNLDRPTSAPPHP